MVPARIIDAVKTSRRRWKEVFSHPADINEKTIAQSCTPKTSGPGPSYPDIPAKKDPQFSFGHLLVRSFRISRTGFVGFHG